MRPTNTADLVRLVGGTPVVIKLIEGTQGKASVLAETDKAAESVIDAFRRSRRLFPGCSNSSRRPRARHPLPGRRGKVVAAMQRKAGEGEFRSNLHRGRHRDPDPDHVRRAQNGFARGAHHGPDVAGVDIMRTNRGPAVLEVNSFAGARRHREGDQAGHRRADHRVPRTARPAGKTRTKGKAERWGRDEGSR